jgi:dienelactone hydrolase
VILFCVFAAAPALAFEETTRQANVGGASITVTVFKPAGRGPFPLAVISRGSPRSPSDRSTFGRARFPAQVEAFVNAGFVVAVPTRRGYGVSGGAWAEGIGTCEAPDYVRAGRATAADIRETVRAMSADPSVDRNRVVLVGQSAGGFSSVAAASSGVPGLRGVINFAGGRGSRSAGEVCSEDRLVAAFGSFASGRVQQLWIYTENDLFFSRRISDRFHQAFTSRSGRAQLVRAPAHGSDGHNYFRDGQSAWQADVIAFARRAVAAR